MRIYSSKFVFYIFTKLNITDVICIYGEIGDMVSYTNIKRVMNLKSLGILGVQQTVCNVLLIISKFVFVLLFVSELLILKCSLHITNSKMS